MLIFLLLLHENICSGFSLEVSCHGPTLEYSQHVCESGDIFMWHNYFRAPDKKTKLFSASKPMLWIVITVALVENQKQK